MPMHALFILTDIYIYEIEIGAIIFDALFLWMSFYNYMTLNKIICGIQAAFYAVAMLVALTHLKRIITEIDTWGPFILYFLQYLFSYPVFALWISDRLYKHFMQ